MNASQQLDSIEGWFNFQDLYGWIASRAPDGATIVEVGCWKGKSVGFLALQLRALEWKGRLVVVDTFRGDGDCGNNAGSSIRAEFEENMRSLGVLDMIEIVEGDSAGSASLFENGSVWFAFIDAAHDEDSARRDVSAWLPKIMSGGILAGHDWQSRGVRVAVKELVPTASHDGVCWFQRVGAPAPKAAPILSILTPTIPGREEQLAALQKTITDQCSGMAVEHLSLSDNRSMSVGEKRQALLNVARGEYVAFVDDDDTVGPEYIAEILAAIQGSAADVICFKQEATINADVGIVDFDMRHRQNEPFQPGGVCTRPPWHSCVWRKDVAIKGRFPDTSYGEDWQWAMQVLPHVLSSAKIEKVLHYYRHSAETTAAPPPL